MIDVPFPPLLQVTGTRFVGRRDEIAAVRAAATAAGELPRVIVLAGEPGIGKTRTAAHIASELYGEGRIVIAGRCDEGLRMPYQPFVDALRHVIHGIDPERLSQFLGRYPSELQRLAPELAELVPGLPAPLRSDPETEQYRMFEAVASWLAALADEAPLVFVLDDLQWAAQPTLLLFRHLATSAQIGPVSLLVTYRDTEADARHPLSVTLADVRSVAEVVRVPLSGLDVAGADAFVESATDEQPAGSDRDRASLIRSLLDHTAGNPFFLGEVVRDLMESGRLRQAVDALVPPSVQEVVGARLARLPETTRDVLTIAAVVGHEFDAGLVASVLGVDHDDVLGALEHGVGARLVQEVDSSRAPFRFAHAIVRTTIRDGLSAARRAMLHKRIAEAIEGSARADERVAEMAHHYRDASGPESADRAITYAIRAGQQALDQLAYAEAVEWFSDALALLIERRPHDAQARCELLLLLGDSQCRAGDPVFRQTLLDAGRLALRLKAGDLLARAALTNTRGTYSAASLVDRDRVEILRAALDVTPAADSPERALLLAHLGLELTFSGDWDGVVRYSDEALAIARRLGDNNTLAHALLRRHESVWHAETLADRLAGSAEMEALSKRMIDPQIAFFAALYGFDDALEAEQFDLAEQRLADAVRLADHLRQPTMQWLATIRQATRALTDGRLDEADELARLEWQRGRASGQPDAFIIYVTQQYQVLMIRGRLGELDPALVEANADANPQTPALRIGLALLRCIRGELDLAEAAIAPLAKNGFADLAHDGLWICAAANALMVSHALGDAGSAAVLYEGLRPFVGQSAAMGPTWQGPVARYLGLAAQTMGRRDEACEFLEDAVARCARVRALPWQTFAEVDLAGALADRGSARDVERVVELLAAAEARAASIGMAGIAADAARVRARYSLPVERSGSEIE